MVAMANDDDRFQIRIEKSSEQYFRNGNLNFSKMKVEIVFVK